jgi:hypothetical protein
MSAFDVAIRGGTVVAPPGGRLVTPEPPQERPR